VQSIATLKPEFGYHINRNLFVPHTDHTMLGIAAKRNVDQLGASETRNRYRFHDRVGRQQAIQVTLEQDDTAAKTQSEKVKYSRHANPGVKETCPATNRKRPVLGRATKTNTPRRIRGPLQKFLPAGGRLVGMPSSLATLCGGQCCLSTFGSIR
jgi:hypothetical protein